MDISLFLAKVVGLYLTIIGLALLSATDQIIAVGKEYTDPKNKVSLFLGGLMALIIGLLIVLSHNVWVLGWPVIITIIGWASLIKGCVILLFPAQFSQFAKWYMKQVNFKVFGIIYIILGLVMSWYGFGL